ncbi:hypothetical protein M5D10_07480 [Leptospira santarosai]|uniref:hypothetical protein n=1 Tax=Leptospira santarosai TaxID=28183 RepID=UPI0022A9E7FA|nr:hypothetical protein [Leptospira santarosai]UZN08763.1 hypothetical protein M5D10_07480 [Leptospira santarosai]
MNQFIISCFILITLSSCSRIDGPKANLVFSFQEGYNGQDISLFVNRNKIFENKNLVTDPTLGLAGTTVIENISGQQETELFINGKSVSRFDIFIDSDTFIGYNLYGGTDFTIIISKKPFIYE